MAQQTDRPWRSLVFLTLTALQLGVALGVRPRLFTGQNPFLPLAVAGSVLLACAGLYVPVLQELLGTEGLGVSDAALGLSTALIGWAGARVTQRAGAASSTRTRGGGGYV